MSTLLMLAAPGAPIAAAIGYAWAGWRTSTRWLGAAASVWLLAVAVALAVRITRHGSIRAIDGLCRVDALSVWMLLVIGAVSLVATLANPAHLDAEIAAGASARSTRRYLVLIQAFVATMTAAVLAANLGTLWVAVEATTIVTAFLVGHRHHRAAVEAAWKYVVICSVGIALALLGVVLLNYAAARTAAHGLDLDALTSDGAVLDPGVTRIAVALLLLGFGAKAGLAPLHAWLPDAHSQAPAPVSALMSGVLLSVSFYALLRVKLISDAALGPDFARRLLLTGALAGLVLAAMLLIAQRDYKRMLAYSSMEHMGLLGLGAAIGGPAAMAGVLLHVLGHGLGKSVLFVGSGQILQTTGTSHIEGVRGLATSRPLLAGAFGVGILALIGMPPFPLFVSQLSIVRAGFAAGLGWAVVAAVLLMLIAAGALLVHSSGMLLGAPSQTADTEEREPVRSAVPLVTGLVACAALGITIWPVAALLQAAAAVGAGR
ncbi:MAG TPA: proton-conducting transporter membrane subunit [Sporichthyaceae bacterium]|jgi:hydrogenase-4 component F|nr:proton-conducting transporter membrane subunit [Sporichthyaceae bacterium]